MALSVCRRFWGCFRAGDGADEAAGRRRAELEARRHPRERTSWAALFAGELTAIPAATFGVNPPDARFLT